MLIGTFLYPKSLIQIMSISSVFSKFTIHLQSKLYIIHTCIIIIYQNFTISGYLAEYCIRAQLRSTFANFIFIVTNRPNCRFITSNLHRCNFFNIRRSANERDQLLRISRRFFICQSANTKYREQREITVLIQGGYRQYHCSLIFLRFEYRFLILGSKCI